jgi:hypothetical protein
MSTYPGLNSYFLATVLHADGLFDELLNDIVGEDEIGGVSADIIKALC